MGSDLIRSDLDRLSPDELADLLQRVERGELSAAEFERVTSSEFRYEVDGRPVVSIRTVGAGPKTRLHLASTADVTGQPQLASEDLRGEALGDDESAQVNRRDFLALLPALVPLLPQWIRSCLDRYLKQGPGATPQERNRERQAWFQAKEIARRVYRPFTPEVVLEAEEEALKLLTRRQELYADYANPRSSIAKRAIDEYVAGLAPDFYQIHVARPELGARSVRSFGIDRRSFDYLWTNQLFPRLRYRPGQYLHPEPPIILRAWGSPLSAMLILTTTRIHGRIDSSTFILLVKRDGRWQSARAYLVDCPPESFAWRLGTARLSATDDDLPNRGPLGITRSQVESLTRAHEELVRGTSAVGFRYFRTRSFETTEKIEGNLRREHAHSEMGPEGLATWIDLQLTRPR